ncbi:MAG: AAA family ATPase [Anaerolineales bacterium]|nr:AAA family ATPase [Anaerolineales bacterium]
MEDLRLNIKLFQTLNVTLEDNGSLDLGSPKAKSLFAFLVLNHQQSIDRRRLAFLFWPRTSEAAARRNLRQYLHRIRRTLEPIDPNGRFLSTSGHQVKFNPPLNWYLDVEAFEAAATPPDENLVTAVQLYSGDLLEDIYDDWVERERDRLARLYRECLLRLINQQEQNGQFQNAIQYARQYLLAEPFRENTYLQLMRLYYLTGNRGGVKQAFEQLQNCFREELGAEPLPETVALYQTMLAGDYQSTESVNQSSRAKATPNRILVSSASPASHDLDSLTHSFIGRTKELAQISAVFNNTLAAQGGFFMLYGESGVGKTHLVSEWLQKLKTAVTLLNGQGHEFESMIPYSPLNQALQTGAPELNWDLFQPTPPWLPAITPLLPDWPQYLQGSVSSIPQTNDSYHVVEGLGNFLLTLARDRPVIVYMDNLHWVDTPTWNFLAYLARRAKNARLLIIGVARNEDLSHDRVRLVHKLKRLQLAQTVDLQRLSQSDTYALVRQLMADPDLDPLFLRRIYEETEGNPFFITETIRTVREAGGDWTQSVPTDASGQRPFFAVPLQIQSVIESRLDKLNEDSRAALGVAAAIGREFSFATLQAVSRFDTETLLNALDEWLARGLVRDIHDGYDFSHEQLSRAAYRQLSRARRQWIHLQIGDYLAQQSEDANPAQLAHHYYLSSEPARALPYLTQAGQRALRVRSYAEAREFGLRAIGLLGRFSSYSQEQRTERLDLNLQLAQAYAFTGALPKASQMLQDAERSAEALGDMTRLTHIFMHSSRIFWLHGHPINADDYARRTLRHAEELDDPELRLAALRMLGRVNIVLSHYDDAISYLLRYIDLTDKGVPRVDLPAIYGYLGVAYARVGSWQRAIDAAQRGLELASIELTGAMHVVARMQLAFVYAELREWEESLAIAEPIREQWREEGMTPYAFMLRIVVGRCLANIQPGSAGPAKMQTALQWAEEVEYRVQIHLAHLYLAQAQLQTGLVDSGLGTAVTAIKLAQKTGDRWSEAVALRTLAELSIASARPDWQQIETNLIRSMHLLRQIRARPDLARTYLSLRRLYDRAGQTAWAVDCHFRATTIYEELGMKAELSIAQGRPGGERTGAVVIPGLALSGPNEPKEK